MIEDESDALARLDELREKREEAHQSEQAALDEIKAVLVEAAALRDVDGEPINRSTLIEHSGLSRRTAYQALSQEQDDE